MEVQNGNINNSKQLIKQQRGDKMKIQFKNYIHRKAFTAFISSNVKDPYSSRGEFLAAAFLLSADKLLWIKSQNALTGRSINFDNIILSGISAKGYALFKAAKAVYNNGADISLSEMCDPNLIDESTLRTIFSGVLLLRNGYSMLNQRGV